MIPNTSSLTHIEGGVVQEHAMRRGLHVIKLSAFDSPNENDDGDSCEGEGKRHDDVRTSITNLLLWEFRSQEQ